MVHCKKYHSSQKGFSLIELVLYMGLMTILVATLGSVFSTIVDVQLESNATSSVDQDGRYILQKLLYDFQGNTPVTIVTPSSVGVPSSTMVLNLNSDPTNSTYSINGSNNLIVANSYGSNQLNSSDTSVASLSATRIGNGSTTDTVAVTVTIQSRTKERGGYESKTFTSTFAGHN